MRERERERFGVLTMLRKERIDRDGKRGDTNGK